MLYKHAAVGGTFDHLHAGHRYLLQAAFAQAEDVTIGITNDAMTENKELSGTIEPFEVRKSTLKTFLKEYNFFERIKIVELKDIYGDAQEDKTLEAIYVTEDTNDNAQKINSARKENNLPLLDIVLVPLLQGDDDSVINSNRIRLGQIDRNGHAYLNPFRRDKTFTVPDLVRDELKSPIGELIKGKEEDYGIAAAEVKKRLKKDKSVLVITVGDIATHSLQTADVEPDISIIDNRSRRTDITHITHSSIGKEGPFENKPATINSLAVQKYAEVIEKSVSKKSHVQFVVEGEEDLLGLPAILLAPLGAVVLYGQVDEGIVYVLVTEEIKRYCDEVVMRLV